MSNETEYKSLLTASIALLCLVPVGCFDAQVVHVSDVDAGIPSGAESGGNSIVALAIDDFEDGNREPLDPRFWHWQCGSYNSPTTDNARCQVTSPGYRSSFAYSVDFELADTKNGKWDVPGVTLTTALMPTVDLSGYRNLVFSAKLVPDAAAFPGQVTLRVNLACATIGPKEPNPGVFSIGSGLQPSNAWQTFTLPLSGFVQFEWNSGQMPINIHTCVTIVDALTFEFIPDFVDGEATAGTLAIDNVYLQ